MLALFDAIRGGSMQERALAIEQMDQRWGPDLMAVLNPNDPNVAILEVVADRTGSALRKQLVFVGGAVAGLLVTDAGLPAIRPTGDVDLIAQVLARSEYVVLEALACARLRE